MHNFYNILKEKLIQFTPKILSMVMNYVLAFALIKLIGIVEYGRYQYYFSSIAMISAFSLFGMDLTSAKEISKSHVENGNKDQRIISKYLLSTTFILFLISPIILLLIFNKLSSTVIGAILFCTLLVNYLKIIQSYHQGIGNFNIAQSILSILVPIILLAITFSTVLVITHHATTILFIYLIALAFSTFITTKNTKLYTNTTKLIETSRSLWSIIKKSFHYFTSSVAFIALESMGILALGYAELYRDAGIFDVSKKIMSVITIGQTVINISLTKLIVIAAFTEDKYLLKSSFKSSAFNSFVIGLGAFILIFLGINLIDPLTLGVEKNNLYLLYILGLSQLFNAMSGSVTVVLNMTGDEHKVSRALIITALISLAGYAYCIPKYGLIGAVGVYSAGVVVWNILLTFEVYRKYGMVSFYKKSAR